MPGKSILTCNAGSSSIKLGLFDAASRKLQLRGHVSGVRDISYWLEESSQSEIVAVGHRVVHGGTSFTKPVKVDDTIFAALQRLEPLAPLHEPLELKAIADMRRLLPSVPQIACFDTAFHHTQSRLEQLTTLPRLWQEKGVIRYGFHGLSYEYIASVLPSELRGKKIIVAHLGNGSSMCAIQDGKSIASTMGFSTLDGLMMGTRPGALDAGVILHLIQHEGLSISRLSHILYHESGLKGVSGISSDMRDLLESHAPDAKEAVSLYCYLAAKQLGGLMMAVGGMDALVFTGGIGENAAPVRAQICGYLRWLNATIHPAENARNSKVISGTSSQLPIYVIPTNEEQVIADACHNALLS